MKRTLVIALLSTMVFAACIKNNTIPTTPACVNVSASSDEPAIKAYTNADTIAYTRDTSLVYYHVFDSGAGNAANSTIFFTYKASLINDSTVSQSTTVLSSPVINLIAGFQYMRRLYKKGAHIKMLIPSIWAYGCQGVLNGSTYLIPPNSVLVYDFVIKDVQ